MRLPQVRILPSQPDMNIIVLHDINNPTQEIEMDAEDFSIAVPFGSGSSIRLKSSDQPIAVAENPRQVQEIVGD